MYSTFYCCTRSGLRGFSVLAAQGMGQGAVLQSPMELVQGRSGRKLVLVAGVGGSSFAVARGLGLRDSEPRGDVLARSINRMWEARMKFHLARLALALAALVSADAWASGPALPLASEQLFGLPPEQTVRRLLSQLPQLRIGALNNELAGAEQTKLAAGPGEWTVRGGISQRSVLEGDRYREQELMLERSIRWFGKAGQDRALGEKGLALALAQRAEAWHEAGRSLMQEWFDALKVQATLDQLKEQHTLIKQLRSIAELRVKAGDGARLELMQADTELRRAAALIEQAEQQVYQALTSLSTTYPGIPTPQLAQVPDPRPNAVTAARSAHSNPG